MNKIKALKKYLEGVRLNIRSTTGALKEFWEREETKTSRKIESLAK